MAIISSYWIVDSLIFLITLIYLLYWYLSKNNNYFRDRGIPYIKPTPFLGSWDSLTLSQYDLSRKLYNTYKDEKYFGYFQSTVPCLVVNDPALIQRILVNDFEYFHDRPLPPSEQDTLDKNLFNLKGQHWRLLRQKLTPTFSAGKIKRMFDQLNQCADHLIEEVEEANLKRDCVDANNMMMKYTIEVIGNIAFGLDLGKDKPFTKEFNEQTKVLFNNDIRQFVIFFFQLAAPKLLSFFNFSLFPPSVNEYFYKIIRTVKEYRKKNKIKRDDYFQLLLSLQEAEESGRDEDEYGGHCRSLDLEPQLPATMFSDQDLTCHTFVFLIAGTETVSSTMSLALYHVAKNPTIEAKIKDDINRAIEIHQGWTYDAVKDMTYLDQVIQETQRMYPSVALNDRECTKPYTIPGTDILLEKGTFVNIPVAGLQMDPRYFPDPEVFDPDRFADNAYKPNATFMPFGNGPRICIGMKFAILEMKICLAKIFYEYSVEVNGKTKEPFTFDPVSFPPFPVGGIWINFKRRCKTPL